MILQIFDVPSHFQESPVWNYFDFLFEDMGYSYICINMKKYLVCQTIDYMQMSYDYEYKELSIPFIKNQRIKNKYSQIQVASWFWQFISTLTLFSE